MIAVLIPPAKCGGRGKEPAALSPALDHGASIVRVAPRPRVERGQTCCGSHRDDVRQARGPQPFQQRAATVEAAAAAAVAEAATATATATSRTTAVASHRRR